MKIKMVLLDHGIFTNSNKVARDIRNHAHVYERYSLICSATDKYDKAPMLKNTKAKSEGIVVTGMPQFDSLYTMIKENNFTIKEPGFGKTILFVGGNMILSEKNKYVPRTEYYNYLEHLFSMTKQYTVYCLIQVCKKKILQIMKFSKIRFSNLWRKDL